MLPDVHQRYYTMDTMNTMNTMNLSSEELSAHFLLLEGGWDLAPNLGPAPNNGFRWGAGPGSAAAGAGARLFVPVRERLRCCRAGMPHLPLCSGRRAPSVGALLLRRLWPHSR